MISLIVCTYNRDKYIGEMLMRIAGESYPPERYEIVLVDNNSTDRTADCCKAFAGSHPEIHFRYILEREQGLSNARNRGIREARGDILVFLDDDAFVAPGYLTHLERALEQHPDAAAFGGRIRPLFETGEVPRWLCKWNYSWVSALDAGDKDLRMKDQYPIGANMGFRRSTFERCGGFSPSLGRKGKNMMGGEEKDLFLRIRKAGLAIYYFPDVQVQHVIPESRTTRDYIIRYAQGVGASEYIRCRQAGKTALLRRQCAELVKWGASLILWILYACRRRPACGNSLLLFRRNVSKALFFPAAQ